MITELITITLNRVETPTRPCTFNAQFGQREFLQRISLQLWLKISGLIWTGNYHRFLRYNIEGLAVKVCEEAPRSMISLNSR